MKDDSDELYMRSTSYPSSIQHLAHIIRYLSLSTTLLFVSFSNKLFEYRANITFLATAPFFEHRQINTPSFLSRRKNWFEPTERLNESLRVSFPRLQIKFLLTFTFH